MNKFLLIIILVSTSPFILASEPLSICDINKDCACKTTPAGKKLIADYQEMVIKILNSQEQLEKARNSLVAYHQLKDKARIEPQGNFATQAVVALGDCQVYAKNLKAIDRKWDFSCEDDKGLAVINPEITEVGEPYMDGKEASRSHLTINDHSCTLNMAINSKTPEIKALFAPLFDKIVPSKHFQEMAKEISRTSTHQSSICLLDQMNKALEKLSGPRHSNETNIMDEELRGAKTIEDVETELFPQKDPPPTSTK